MNRWPYIASVIAAALLNPSALRADNFPGEVSLVEKDAVRITLQYHATPKVGDTVEIFCVNPTIGVEVAVAFGHVESVDRHVARVKITRKYVDAKIRVGHLARFSPALLWYNPRLLERVSHIA